MKLRYQLSIIIILLWAIMATLVYLGAQRLILNSYINLEKQVAVNNLARIHYSFREVMQDLNNIVRDWAIWDETYQFITDKNAAYIQKNMVVSSLASNDTDAMLFYNTTGKLVYSIAINENRTQIISLPDGLLNYLQTSSLIHQNAINEVSEGYVLLPKGIYFVISHAITTSQNKGPVHGTLVIAKLLSQKVINQIEKNTQLDIEVYPITQIPPQKLTIFNTLKLQTNSLIEYATNKNINIYSLLKGISENPIALIQVKMPRNIYKVGLVTLHYFNIALIIYSLFLSLLLWLIIQNFIVRRIENLKLDFQTINSNTLANTTRKDEISTVADLYFQATHDPLTGLANRTLLFQAFSHFVDQLSTGKKIAVLFVDLDYFKRINDILGHDVGDKLLQHVSKQLKIILRKNDIAARIGGDEFVLLVSDISLEEINPILDRISEIFTKAIYIEGHQINISTSVGISYYPDDGTDISTLLSKADLALYQAKAAGRNRNLFYSNSLSENLQKEHKQEIALQKAIDQKELTVFYQPIYHAKTGKIAAFEALLRWRHPTRGLISGGEVIAIAEKSKLINTITEWVIRTVCLQQKHWQNENIFLVPIAINISTQYLKHNLLSHFLLTYLKQIHLDPGLIQLEITETGFMELTPLILNDFKKLTTENVKLAIDDFGAGYSGIGYLKKLPISFLKIDQSFIRDLFTDENDKAITLTVIAIAHQLSLQVIAEGVETKEQFEFLKKNHVDFIQGHLLSEPKDPKEIKKLLIRDNEPQKTFKDITFDSDD